MPCIAKVMTYGQRFKVCGPAQKIWNAIVVSDFYCLNIVCQQRLGVYGTGVVSPGYLVLGYTVGTCNVQNKPAWRDNTCATHT